MSNAKPKTIDEYIISASPEAQRQLLAMYSLLKKAAPGAAEAIKWGSPVFEENRILFAFAAYKSHLNFMPTPSAMKPFKRDWQSTPRAKALFNSLTTSRCRKR
jgi:uncharacterized protein YdhG (YjbR/CyaY superfamily)